MEPDTEQLNIILKLIGLLLLIIASGFFSSSETAFMSVDKIKIRNLASEGNKSAQRVEQILNNKEQVLSAILIGNNFVNIFASSLTTTLVYDMFGNAMISVITGILTLVILIFGEIIPKNIASSNTIKLAMRFSFVISILITILTPMVYCINKISKIIMIILRVYKEPNDKLITEEELKAIVDVSQEEGVLEKEEHELINNVIEFGDSCAKDIMIPRTSIVGVRVTDNYNDIMSIFKEEKYTRLVVYDEEKENVVGIINIRDMIYTNQDEFDIQTIIRNPCFVYEHKKIIDLLNEMKKTSNNMAIIIDEYGDISGLLTLEDILEELVGEIRDEYDEDELEQIIKVDESTYTIDGNIKLDDLNDFLSINLQSEDYDTICGYCIERLEDLPKENDLIDSDIVSIKVLEIENNHIERVQLIIKNQKDD